MLLNAVCLGPTNTPMMAAVLGEGEHAVKWKDAMVREHSAQADGRAGRLRRDRRHAGHPTTANHHRANHFRLRRNEHDLTRGRNATDPIRNNSPTSSTKCATAPPGFINRPKVYNAFAHAR